MSRQLMNVSGETRTLQDGSGRWFVVEPGAVYTVDDRDERYYQTGEQGEPAIWADKPASKSKTTTKESE